MHSHVHFVRTHHAHSIIRTHFHRASDQRIKTHTHTHTHTHVQLRHCGHCVAHDHRLVDAGSRVELPGVHPRHRVVCKHFDGSDRGTSGSEHAPLGCSGRGSAHRGRQGWQRLLPVRDALSRARTRSWHAVTCCCSSHLYRGHYRHGTGSSDSLRWMLHLALTLAVHHTLIVLQHLVFLR
jgi:hypothetical protein